MKLPYGVQSQIARDAGLSLRYLQQLLNGERIPSPKVALKLEKVTGVSRLKWLYPDEFGSPLEALQRHKRLHYEEPLSAENLSDNGGVNGTSET